MDVIGNNIANVNTTAYKVGPRHLRGPALADPAGRVQAATATSAAPTRMQIGLGVRVALHRHADGAGRPAKHVRPDRHGAPGQRLLHARRQHRQSATPATARSPWTTTATWSMRPTAPTSSAGRPTPPARSTPPQQIDASLAPVHPRRRPDRRPARPPASPIGGNLSADATPPRRRLHPLGQGL